MAFGEFCPSVTLECGLSGDADGTDHALAYLDSVLHLKRIESHTPSPEDLELFSMFATVRVDPDTEFGFRPGANLEFPPDLDRFNFRELPPGTRLAKTRNGSGHPLIASGHDGRDVSDECFVFGPSDIMTRKPLMPAMLTTDEVIARNDCLCYFMERVIVEPRDAPAVDRGEDTALPETLT